ncbi:MAG TPA: hypothetical protein VFQ68_19175 [Streptosporangiaceae bacterium]|nr:hypothetical protein [Streptosporangiaceae bacterium]
MSRKPDPADYVTKVDPSLTRKGGPLQVLSSPKAAPEPEPEAEAEI